MANWFSDIIKILTDAGVGAVGLVLILFMGVIVRLLWVWHRDAVRRLEAEIGRAAVEKRYLQDKLFPGILESSEGPERDGHAPTGRNEQ